jgi:hypothetical protein
LQSSKPMEPVTYHGRAMITASFQESSTSQVRVIEQHGSHHTLAVVVRTRIRLLSGRRRIMIVSHAPDPASSLNCALQHNGDRPQASRPEAQPRSFNNQSLCRRREDPRDRAAHHLPTSQSANRPHPRASDDCKTTERQDEPRPSRAILILDRLQQFAMRRSC